MRWEQYIEQVAKIRILSSPEVNTSMSAIDYFDSLNKNFIEIRDLAVSNRAILEEDIYPYLKNTDELLPKEIVNEFGQMSEGLVDAFNMENLDMTMTAQIADRMYLDAVAKGDIKAIISCMDALIEAYYTLLNMTKRIADCSDMCEYYRDKAEKTADILMKYFEKDAFSQLPDEETKETVLINSRYISLLYEGKSDEISNRKEWDILTKSLAIENDSFYREQVPDYDWVYHRMRTLEYFAYMLELHNKKGIGKEACIQIAAYCQELFVLWMEDDRVKEHISEQQVILFLVRSEYFAGIISVEEYKRQLLGLYERRNTSEYGIYEIMQNILIPVEYLLTLGMDTMTEEEISNVDLIYKNVISYVAGMPNTGSLCYLLEYFSEFMSCYIEVPGQSDYMEVCMDAMAALHPPTYVHSNMVARIAKCICRHLLNNSPELFVGVLGFESLDAVLKNRDKIENHIFQGALCHDIGKIWIMDTIFVYGRNLTDDEFNLIKTHPVVGSEILKKFDSTYRYHDMALGHHRWFDNSKGYPSEYYNETKDKIFVDILACADCLDAATDSVGRSYNTKKSIESVLNELIRESGSRYTQIINGVFEDEKVIADLKYLLSEGRRQMYLNTFRRLISAKTAAKGVE